MKARASRGTKAKKGRAAAGGPGGPNEGEGNRTAARRYDEATRDYIASGRSDAAAKEAEAAVSGRRGPTVAGELRRAEEAGKAPARRKPNRPAPSHA